VRSDLVGVGHYANELAKQEKIDDGAGGHDPV
jgi:hypothetical protein